MTQRNTTALHAFIAGLQPVGVQARVSGLLSLVLVLLITTGGAG